MFVVNPDAQRRAGRRILRSQHRPPDAGAAVGPASGPALAGVRDNGGDWRHLSSVSGPAESGLETTGSLTFRKGIFLSELWKTGLSLYFPGEFSSTSKSVSETP